MKQRIERPIPSRCPYRRFEGNAEPEPLVAALGRCNSSPQFNESSEMSKRPPLVSETAHSTSWVKMGAYSSGYFRMERV